MKRVLICAMFAAATMAAGVILEWSDNGVSGAVSNPAGKTVVIAKPSSCNTEAVEFRVRFRRESERTWSRQAWRSERVARCQSEPVAAEFQREADEVAVLVTVRELAVINSSAAPLVVE